MGTSAFRVVLPILFSVFLHNAYAGPADDLKISQLEQDVRELQRVIQQQNRRIEALESTARLSRPNRIAPSTETPTDRERPATMQWLQSTRWDKVRVGMSETEVLTLIGPPTTARTADDSTRTLFYTLELDAGGFLSGQVLISDGKVIEIHRPALR
jgi:hypothetical protein